MCEWLRYLFLGGDEVSGECWSGPPTVQAWMTSHDTDAAGLGRHFWQQMTKLVLPGLNRARAWARPSSLLLLCERASEREIVAGVANVHILC